MLDYFKTYIERPTERMMENVEDLHNTPFLTVKNPKSRN